jgi:DNA-binding YbaB/EbfC family protein
MFDKFKAAMEVMGKAKEMRAKMDEVQAELARKRVEGEAGGGAVRVVMSGKLEVVAVRIDRAMVAAMAGAGTTADQVMVEELLRQAFSSAVDKAQQLMQQEMAEVTKGIDVGALGG